MVQTMVSAALTQGWFTGIETPEDWTEEDCHRFDKACRELSFILAEKGGDLLVDDPRFGKRGPLNLDEAWTEWKRRRDARREEP